VQGALVFPDFEALEALAAARRAGGAAASGAAPAPSSPAPVPAGKGPQPGAQQAAGGQQPRQAAAGAPGGAGAGGGGGGGGGGLGSAEVVELLAAEVARLNQARPDYHPYGEGAHGGVKVAREGAFMPFRALRGSALSTCSFPGLITCKRVNNGLIT
jgi:hypothetical protein